MPADPDFGRKMVELRKERGEPFRAGPGRKSIAEKYKPQIDRTMRVFGDNMPALAQAYVEETEARDPERCAEHDEVLRCPQCGKLSQRTFFDHRAAQYVFDRIMGKPTTRSENAVTVTVVQQLVMAVVGVFGEVNAIPDPAARQMAFAQRCAQLGVLYGGPAA